MSHVVLAMHLRLLSGKLNSHRLAVNNQWGNLTFRAMSLIHNQARARIRNLKHNPHSCKWTGFRFDDTQSSIAGLTSPTQDQTFENRGISATLNG